MMPEICYICGMRKEYKPDDKFKRWARSLQFSYREDVLNDFNEYRAPQVLLSADNAKRGMIFYDGFRDLILSKVGNIATQLTANMLRSEHIPYNLFTPLETMPDIAADIFGKMIDAPVKQILSIRIEYAGVGDKSLYLNDRTSFDTFVEYLTPDNKRGGIGIEVKYTENEYPLGDKEGKDIAGDNRLYRDMTVGSGYYTQGLEISMFLTAHHLRQIWRNHILGYSMLHKGDVNIIHHVHIYPEGNEHFHNQALPEYRTLLTEKGNESFKTVTYESYFDILDCYSDDKRVADWVKYLRKRYLGIG